MLKAPGESNCILFILNIYQKHGRKNVIRCYKSVNTTVVFSLRKATCKRTQHCWPATRNIVGCYVLRPFAHAVACCCVLLGAVAQSLKPVKLLSTCKRTWELLRPFARSVTQCVFYAVIFNTLKSCQRNSCGSVCLLGTVKVAFSTKGCNIIILPWLCQLID